MKRRCGETVGGKDEEEIDLRALEPQDKTEQMWTGEGFGSRDVFDFNYLQLKSPPACVAAGKIEYCCLKRKEMFGSEVRERSDSYRATANSPRREVHLKTRAVGSHAECARGRRLRLPD